jgi:putative inorganic carbon (HCO3(-)) transporter
VIALAALSGPFPKAGIVVVAALVAVALVHPQARPRAAAMLGALVLAPVLLLAAIWNSPQLGIVHRHPLEAVFVAVLGIALISLLAVRIARHPSELAVLVAFAFPFRVPISASGTTSNLLVPLYLVVGAGALAYLVPVLRGRSGQTEQAGDGVASREPAPGWIDRLLALMVLLYAIQALYSPDFEKALQQVVFFYVPFALMFCLLRRLRWSQRLLIRCLVLVAGLAVVFAVIGFAEYATKTLLLNPKLIAQNNVHTYFAVNSVFFDPDIFGRFLALVMVTLAAVLLYSRRQRDQLVVVGVLAVLWAGLVLTLSRSSLGALLVGLGVIGALRWRAKPILLAAATVVVIGGIAVAVSPNTFGVEQGANGVSAGRTSLIGGGVHLFRERPIWGYGSASFETEYLCRIKHQCGEQPDHSQVLSASHTIPITIAAEQGLIGEIPYVALVVAAAIVLLTGARAVAARAAVAAAFIALVFHTLAYADFLEDPATWILLGVGVALASGARGRIDATPERSGRLAAVA